MTSQPPQTRTTKASLVLGRHAFGRISAVEGITVSGRLTADLDRLADKPAATRREVLSAKYGKR